MASFTFSLLDFTLLSDDDSWQKKKKTDERNSLTTKSPQRLAFEEISPRWWSMGTYGNMETETGLLWANANQIPTKHMPKISTVFWIGVDEVEAAVITLKLGYSLKHWWAGERKTTLDISLPPGGPLKVRPQTRGPASPDSSLITPAHGRRGSCRAQSQRRTAGPCTGRLPQKNQSRSRRQRRS